MLWSWVNTAELRAFCERDDDWVVDHDRCKLRLDIEPTPMTEEWKTVVRWETSLPPHYTLADVIKAVDRLDKAELPDPAMGGILGALMGGANEVGLHLSFEEQGHWKDLDPAAVWAPIQDELDACRDDVRRDFWSNDLLVEVNKDGSVIRCEPEFKYRLPEPGAACVCAALSDLNFGAGDGDRRLSIDPAHRFGKVYLADGRGIYVDTSYPKCEADPSVTWAYTGVSAHRLATCLAGREDPGIGEFEVSWAVDAGGRVSRTDVALPEDLNDEIAACLSTELAGAGFSCAQGGEGVVVRSTMRVQVLDQ